MTYSYNLIDSPWIPCVREDGTLAEYGLRETLQRAHDLRGIQGDSPLETAAVYRLLLAVLHSAMRGPANQGEWTTLWQKGKFEPALVDGYLDRWFERFDLFHPEKPFYQAVDLRVKQKSAISLALDLVSGNQAVLFDHHTEDGGVSFTPSKAARTLLVSQNYGLAGLSGLEQKFTDAPWTRGVIFLVEGDNLFKTLTLNMLRYPDEKVLPYRTGDQPAWENEDPYQPERDIPEGYLDYLTWQNRRGSVNPRRGGWQPDCTHDDHGPRIKAVSLYSGSNEALQKRQTGRLYDHSLFRGPGIVAGQRCFIQLEKC